jgi:hypothetical protein
VPTSGSRTNAKGLAVIEHGNVVTLDPNLLEATRNFFYASGFDVQIYNSELHILFSQSSKMLKSNKVHMAIEVIMPLNHSIQGLYKSVFVEPAASNTQSFFEVIRTNNSKHTSAKSVNSQSFKIENIESLEANSSNFRQVPANYARFAFSLDEGMIEFYEGNPIFIHTLTSKKHLRENDGMHSVFAVICSTLLLENLLNIVNEKLLPHLDDSSKKEV